MKYYSIDKIYGSLLADDNIMFNKKLIRELKRDIWTKN